mgnify:CR=1 FL=1
MSEKQTLENQSPSEGGNDDFTSSEEVQDLSANDEGLEGLPQEHQDDSLEEQRERSRLGRKVASFEQEISGLKQTISELTSMLATRQDGTRAMEQPIEDAPPVDYISTPEDLERYNQWKEAKMSRQRNEYANRYIHSVKSMSYINPDLHADIEAELFTNVDEYPTYSGHTDPVADAGRNYLKAENKLLKMKLVGGQAPQANVKGGVHQPTGLSTTSQVSQAQKPQVKLDPYAEKFLRALGEDTNSEWVQKSLARKE